MATAARVNSFGEVGLRFAAELPKLKGKKRKAAEKAARALREQIVNADADRYLRASSRSEIAKGGLAMAWLPIAGGFLTVIDASMFDEPTVAAIGGAFMAFGAALEAASFALLLRAGSIMHQTSWAARDRANALLEAADAPK